MTETIRMKSALALGVVIVFLSGCTLLPYGLACDVDTYAEMVFPTLQVMQDIGEQLTSAQDAGDIEQVKLLRTHYLLNYNALKSAPTSWCTQQMHQEFLLSSEAYLNAVDLWLDGDVAAANFMIEQANQHWNQGWRSYDRIGDK